MNSYYEMLKEVFMQHKDVFIEDNKLTALGCIFLVSAVIRFLDIKEIR